MERACRLPRPRGLIAREHIGRLGAVLLHELNFLRHRHRRSDAGRAAAGTGQEARPVESTSPRARPASPGPARPPAEFARQAQVINQLCTVRLSKQGQGFGRLHRTADVAARPHQIELSGNMPQPVAGKQAPPFCANPCDSSSAKPVVSRRCRARAANRSVARVFGGSFILRRMTTANLGMPTSIIAIPMMLIKPCHRSRKVGQGLRGNHSRLNTHNI